MADALGFPDATDTGVQAGVTLTPYNGNLIINTPGVVIENLDIHGYVIINASNVTLKNCKVTTDNFWGISVGGGGWSTGGTGCVIQNCEVNGLGTGDGASGIVGGGSFIANNIYGWENGIVPDQSNTLIQDNYIHDLQGAGNPHYDGIDIEGGGYSNIVIRHNTIINPHTQTSAFYMSNDFGSVSNVIIDNNKLIGGGWTVYSDQKASLPGKISGVQFTNNVMSKGYYGYADIANNSVVWSGNTDLATGQTVSQGGTLSPNSQISITNFSTDSGVAGDHITNDSTLTLTGTAVANSTVKVFDGANQIGTATASSSGAWTYTTAALTDGSHSLTAKNTAGTSSTALSVTIDTAAPSTPSIVSNTVNASKVTLNGTAEANSKVQVFDGSTQLATVTTNGSGAWTYTTNTLNTGTHNFTAKATDAAGNSGGASSAASVTIGSSTQGPGVPTIGLFSTDSGTAGDRITNDSTLTLTGTAVANSTVNVYDGTKLLGTAAADSSGAWSFATGALTNGAHSFTATDTVSGTTSAASSAFNVTIDTTAPSAPVIGSNSVSPTNIVTLSGTAEANSTVTLFDGTKQLGTVTANTSGNWNFATAALSAGSHSFTAKDTDVAGNTSAVSSTLNLALTTPVPVNLLADTASWSNLAFPTQTTNFTASFDATPSKSGADIVIGLADTKADAWTDLAAVVRFNDTNTIDVRNGSGYGADASVPYNAGTNYHFRMVVDPSTHTYSVYVTPQGGSEIALATNYAFRTEQATNSSLSGVGGFSTSGSAAVFNFSVVGVPPDTVAPAAPTIALFSTDSGKKGDSITNDNTLTLSGAAEANATVKVFEGAKLLGSVVANGSGAWTFTTAALAEGAHTFTSTATDAAGNASGASTSLAVTIDTKKPNIPVISGDTVLSTAQVSLTGTAEANSTVNVSDGTKVLGTATADGGGAWSYTTNALTAGPHAFTATASDLAGNTSSVSPIYDPIVGGTTIEASGTIELIRVGDRYYIDAGSGAVPTLLKFGGSDFVAGQFGSWAPIGVEKTASGYEVAWKDASTGQYTAWNTDNNGNYVSNMSGLTGYVSGTSTALESLETSFHQDLNGDGQIGLVTTAIETQGATDLAQVGGHYFFEDSTGSGPSLKFGGTDFVAGQFGNWAPIGVEKTASGYEVVWKDASTGQYTAWNTDNNGNYVSNMSGLTGYVSGTSTALESIETSFHQDLNGDGQIGLVTTAIETQGATDLAQAGGHYFLEDSSGSGPSLKFGGTDFVAGQFGTWAPIGAEKTASGYEVAWKDASTGQYTAWNTDNNGNYVSNTSTMKGYVSGTSTALESFETSLHQDLNKDGYVGLVLDGSAGGQTLNASSSPTTLIGGQNVILNGGAGADTFVFPANFGANTVNNFAPGTDALQFSQSMFANVAAVLGDAQQVGSNVVITHDPQNVVTLHNVQLTNLHASDIHIV